MAYIAHGTYGCVFRPAVSCNAPDKKHKGTVAKLFRKDHHAQLEVDVQQLVHDIDPQHKFTVPLVESCYVPVKKYRQLYKCSNWSRDERYRQTVLQLVYNDGGMEIYDAASMFPFERILIAFRPIFDGLVTLQRHNICHLDIKPANIVYNLRSKKCALIDFGLAMPFHEVYDQQHILEFAYPYYPPEFRVAAFSPTAIRQETYKNWIKCVRRVRTHFAVDENIHDLVRPLLHIGREKDQVKEMLKQYTYNSRAEHVHKVDVYMLGSTLLEIMAVATYHQKILLHKDNIPMYSSFVQLLLDMTRLNPKYRITPMQAKKRYLEIVRILGDIIPSTSPQVPSKNKRSIDRKPDRVQPHVATTPR